MKKGICKNILYSNAIQLIKNNEVKVIDVRDNYEIKNNTVLPKSINIPLNDLSRRIKYVALDKTQPILVYCATGSRSIYACQILADCGYLKVYNLQGGINGINKS